MHLLNEVPISSGKTQAMRVCKICWCLAPMIDTGQHMQCARHESLHRALSLVRVNRVCIVHVLQLCSRSPHVDDDEELLPNTGLLGLDPQAWTRLELSRRT